LFFIGVVVKLLGKALRLKAASVAPVLKVVAVLLILGLTYNHQYAKEVNVGCPTHRYNSIKGNENYTKCYSTAVIIHIKTQHTGHDPEEDRDVNMLRIDDR